MMVRTSKTQKKKEMPTSPVRSRLSSFASKFFESRAEAKAAAVRAESRVSRRAALKSMAALLGLGVMTACAPGLANDKTLRSPKEAPPSKKKEKSEVTYETFSDPKELEPYFKNAEGKFVNFKLGEQKKVGPYLVSVEKDGTGVNFELKVDGSTQEFGVGLTAPLPEVNVLVIDVPESNPYIKGKMLVFTDNDSVYFQYFNKKENRHETRGVPLWEGKMRAGPIRTGFGVDNGTIFVINSPKDLKTGDVVCQAQIHPNGSSGGFFYMFAPDKPAGMTVASL
ncbi:MAG: hypothetical protein ACLFUZ_04000 [Candidatus Micrarchaeia archaeon]